MVIAKRFDGVGAEYRGLRGAEVVEQETDEPGCQVRGEVREDGEER
jgi:hypothetical protein